MESQAQIRDEVNRLREYANERARELVQPERLRGCECSTWENHEGRCSGADCFCH